MKINDIQSESWSQKYKSSIDCSHPKGFSQKAHCAGKKKQNESVEMEMVCEDCGMCKSHGSLNEIRKGAKDSNGVTKCWPGKHAEGTKKGKNGGQVRNCVPNESVAESEKKGLYYNVNKRKAAGTSRDADSPKAPTAQAWKDAAKTAKKESVAEAMRPVPVDDQGNRIPDRMSSNEPNRPFGQPGDSKSSPKGVVTYTPTGLVHRSNHGDVTPRPRAVPEDANPNYIWIQGDFDGDTATTGPKQGNWRDQQTTQVELTRGRMSNVRPLSGPPPEGGKTIKQAQIPLTLDAGNQKFSTTGVDLQLTVAPNGYISQGGVGRVRGTAVVKIMRPGNVAEGSQRVDSLVTDALKIMRGSDYQVGALKAIKTVLGDREYNSRRGFYNFYVKQLMDMLDQEGLAEGSLELNTPDPVVVIQDLKGNMLDKLNLSVASQKYKLGNPQNIKNQLAHQNYTTVGSYVVVSPMGGQPQDATTQGVAEGFNGEYDDEAGMAQGNLYTIAQAAQGLLDTIDDRDNLPEWAQEKIAKVEGMLVSVWNYLQSQKAQGIDPEINEMYEAMDQLAEEMAAKKGISADLVWESFEALDDHMLYETAAWRRKEGKSKKGGLNAKGVASYRRENPGSKLQTAVTTKPSKLKAGSKAAKRRKSFCARMSGVKGPAKKPNGEPTRKTLALRKWNC